MTTQTDSSPQGEQQGAGLSALTNKVTTLTEQLTKAGQELETARNRIKELEGQAGGLTTANKQANEKLTTFEKQLADAQKALEAKNGEATNWSTQYQQLNEQHGKLTTDFGQTQRELELYRAIAGNPDYHGLIGMVNGIRVANTPDEQKTILDAMAKGLKGHSDQMINLLRGGGQPPAGSGGSPASVGPKSIQEAHARLQQIAGIPQFQQEANQLMDYIMQQQGAANQPA
jgi:uncharacterized phage infection (PIP) family protein YhgE